MRSLARTWKNCAASSAIYCFRSYSTRAWRRKALRAANDKFERRYRAMEQIAEGRFAGLSLDEQEALWQRVKRDPEG